MHIYKQIGNRLYSLLLIYVDMKTTEKEFRKYINTCLKIFLCNKLKWNREDLKDFWNFILADYYFTPEPQDLVPYGSWVAEIINKARSFLHITPTSNETTN